MHDTFNSDNARDWQQRYGGTFGFLMRGSERVLVQFTDQTENYVYFKTESDGISYHAKINAGTSFEFIQVDNAWFNGKSGTVYLLSRLPNRQWRRGICKANTSVLMSQGNYVDQASISFKILNDIYYTATPDYSCKGLISTQRAISRSFAIVHPYLYFYDQVVGKLNENTIVLNSKGVLIKQELTDVMRRNGYDKFYQVGVEE
jgi:hypothetical protein